jgi:hypothetical protein
MVNQKRKPLKINTGRYYILSPILPFIDIILQSIAINKREFSQIELLAADYQNDPRMIEMVRRGGDASAKVPYLMEKGETADSILDTLREIAQPQVERLHGLPDSVQATIHLLLSINTVPKGCEICGIPALLEIDRMQGEIVRALHDLISNRQLAMDFHNNNSTALQMLDRDWPRLRENKSIRWPNSPLPENSRVHYKPFFNKDDRLIYLQETCVILDSPDAQMLRRFTPAVLQNPLPANVPVPATGSADWLIRSVGKIGRHFTRALLGIIKTHLDQERIALEIKNYERINQEALDALRDYVERMP